MTLGALEIKKVRRYFKNSDTGAKPFRPSASPAPLSGKTLAHRLKGLLTKKAAHQLDCHINESCEQIDD
jgi:hypothetical protein